MDPRKLNEEEKSIYRVFRAAVEGKNVYDTRRAIEALEWSLRHESVVKKGSAAAYMQASADWL